jgi:capsid protein
VTELLAGRIAGELDALLDVEWITPAPAWVDPKNDAEAATLMLEQRLTSRRRVIASLGWNIRDIDREIAADPNGPPAPNAIDRARASGVTLSDGQPSPSPDARGARPSPEDEDLDHAA